MKILLLKLCLILVAINAQAGTAVGKVTRILIGNASNAILFELNTEIKETPRCNVRQQFAMDLRQVGGKAMYTALLEAKEHDYIVSVTGLNTCAVQNEAEGVKNIEIQ